MVAAAVSRTLAAMNAQAEGAVAFRAVVTGVSGGLATIRRDGATTADSEQYASCSRFLLTSGDEVLCVPLGVNGQAVIVERINRESSSAAVFTALAPAGSTASLTDSEGITDAGFVKLVPGGSGITTGDLLGVAFAVELPNAKYSVNWQPYSAAARTAGLNVYPVARFSTGFVVATDVSLTSGSTYQWMYQVRRYG